MIRRNPLPELERCRERALGLVSQRPHTVMQLREKLHAKGFARENADEIVNDFLRAGLLDDRRLAYDYCRYMKSASSPAGRNRIIGKLRGYGVDPELVAEAVADAWDNGGEEDEVGRAVAAARGKIRLIRDLSDPRKTREKLFRFLAAKGFDGGVCRQAVDLLIDDHA